MSLSKTASGSGEILRPGNRFINEGNLGGFVYKITQANEQRVIALVYPYGLARDNKAGLKRGDQIDVSPDIFERFKKISLNEAKPYETGEIR